MGILKTLGGLILLIFFVGVLAVVWFLYKLPSTYEVAQTLQPRISSPLIPTAPFEPPPSLETNGAVGMNGKSHDSEDRVVSVSVSGAAKKSDLLFRVLENDLMNSERPLVDACKNLRAIDQTPLYRSAGSASVETLFQGLDRPQQDPLADSASPFLRYVFRAPGISNMMEMAQQAQLRGESEGLFKKTEFYYELYKAGRYLYQQRQELNQVLQKSYNMHHFMKAVAQKPELAQDPAVTEFCEQLENSVNTPEAFDAEVAAQEMQNFFSEVGVDAQKFGYNPKYRSQIQVGMKANHISLNDNWLSQLFRHDIQKATSQKVSQ